MSVHLEGDGVRILFQDIQVLAVVLWVEPPEPIAQLKHARRHMGNDVHLPTQQTHGVEYWSNITDMYTILDI